MFENCSAVQKIFEGGQKTVYKAMHDSFGEVVIKVGKFPNLESLERIKREVEFLSNLDSIYYPKIYSFQVFPHDFNYRILEEFIPSKKVTELKAYYSTEEKLVELLRHTVDGLKLLWQNNIVHRDLKPDNILITESFQPKIIDLGIARFLDMDSLTKTIMLLGPCTPLYAAPEQLTNSKNLIDMRTDFFSLGILLLEMHLGFHPFDPSKTKSGINIIENILRGNYIGPTFKRNTTMSFNRLIVKLLQTQPYNRFKNYLLLEEFIYKNWG